MKYSLKKFWLFTILGIALTTVAGCGKVEPPALTLSAAEHNLKKICAEEYQLEITVRPAGKTVRVYLPVKESFFEFKAEEKKNPDQPTDPQDIRAINFFAARFSNRDLVIDFDIRPTRQYPKQSGLSSAYTEKFQADQRDLLTAIVRIYGDVPEQARPDFFVVIIADILKGLEMRLTFYLPDLMRATVDPSFTEEYSKRVIADEAKGNSTIIGDESGRHLESGDITWQDFLSKQLYSRLRFKYQNSSFPPQDSDVNEILRVVHDTVTAYNFTAFDGVKLRDLSAGKTYDFRKEQLNTFSQ